MTQALPNEGQSLADYLWEETKEYREQALKSNFINGLREKRLDPTDFGAFMVQDSVYVHEGMVSLETAAANSDSGVDIQEFLRSKAESWKGYCKGLYEAWHINETEGIILGDAARQCASGIRDVAVNELPVYTILALTPCAKLWPWLGQQIESGTRDFGVYTSWVKKNLKPDSRGYLKYEEYVEEAYKRGDVEAEKALEIFTASIQNEVAFFNSVGLSHEM